MARIETNGGRRPGWPPGQSDRPRPRLLAEDDAILVALWVAVLAGLLLLMLIVVLGESGPRI